MSVQGEGMGPHLWSSMKTLAAAVVAGSLLVLPVTGTNAVAKELKYATGYPPNSTTFRLAERYSEVLGALSKGALTAKVFGPELVNLLEVGPSVRDGLADIGYVLIPAYPTEYRHANLITELNLSVNRGNPNGKQHMAFAGAMSEYVFTKCPKCLEDFTAQNQVFGGMGTSSTYVLMCNKSVATAEELKGKRIRTASASFVRLVEALGAVAVQIPANEVFEGLSGGILDCAALAAPEYINFQLQPVVTHLTANIPGGVYASGMSNVNLDVWRGLTTEERGWLLRATAAAAASMIWEYGVATDTTLETAKKGGTNILQATPDVVQAIRDFAAKDEKLIVETYKTKFGVADADVMASDFLSMLDRWMGLVEGLESQEELEALLWNEIYAKIDPSKYGLE